VKRGDVEFVYIPSEVVRIRDPICQCQCYLLTAPFAACNDDDDTEAPGGHGDHGHGDHGHGDHGHGDHGHGDHSKMN